jgi:hypothetical protein
VDRLVEIAELAVQARLAMVRWLAGAVGPPRRGGRRGLAS